jgi:hypothetical protein
MAVLENTILGSELLLSGLGVVVLLGLLIGLIIRA